MTLEERVEELERICGAITEHFNDKSDRDLHNISTEGKSTISSFNTPSNRYIDLTLGESGTRYIAPANGTVYFKRFNNGASGVTNSIFNERTGMIAESFSPFTVAVSLNVLKGDAFVIYHTGSATGIELKFYYAEGEI